MEKLEKIRLILKDFRQYKPSITYCSNFCNILVSIYNPPSYIVQILLLNILGLKNYGRMDKVLWHTYFQYKNHRFIIHDYKFGSWTIMAERNDEEVKKLAKEIEVKIIRASKLLDDVLFKLLKTKIEENEFYLNNVYHKLSYIYEYYKVKVQHAIKSYNEFKTSDIYGLIDIENLSKIWNTRIDLMKTISALSFGLIMSFFSILEFLLNAFFAFKELSIDFYEFKKKYLNDRFKLIFDLNKEKEFKRLYDEVVVIKKRYRNPFAHGFESKEVNLLVPIPYVGLVPLSYEYLLNKFHYGYIEIDENDASYIIGVFENFFETIENTEPYKYYMLYVNYNFPIPMNKEEIRVIKEEMTSYDKFKDYLDAKAFCDDMVLNRDI